MAQPFRNAYKRGDLVRVTEDVQKLIETQWAPEDFANAAAGKYMRIEAAYKDLSYDLDGTPLKLDGSVLEYIGHPKKAEVRKCGHVYADGFHGAQVCVKCLDPKNESILIWYDPWSKDWDKGAKAYWHRKKDWTVVIDKIETV